MRAGLDHVGFIVMGALTVGCGFALLRALVHALRARTRVGPKSAAVVAFLLPCAAFVLFSISHFAHVHPTVQMTHPDTMWAWSLWLRAWPWLFLGLPVSAVVAVAATVWDVRTTGGQGPPHSGWTSLILLTLHGIYWLSAVSNFPSA